GTPDGVYVTTVPCRIYNDNGGDPDNEVENLAYDVGECYDEFQVWLQIGEMKIVIVNPHDVHGEPSERSSDGVFTVKNDGALTVTSVVATATDFIFGPNVIPATASVFMPSPKVGTLKAGFQRNVTWVVDIPDCMPAGVYTGKITAWSDTDGNEQIGLAEASASADVKITVESCPKLSIRNDGVNPANIDELFTPFIMANSTVKQCFRLYNTGNQPITELIQVDKNNLTFMTNAITTDDFSFDIDLSLPIQPGEYRLATVTVTIGDTHLVNGHYRGLQTFYVKSGDTVLCSDELTLDVEFGKKELIVTPDPLIFDDLNNENQKSVTATRTPPAGLKKIYVYEKSHCDRNEAYCNETTITCLREMPVNIVNSVDFAFKVNWEDTHTPPGWHIATWTFFDDSDGDGIYDEGEYFVDFQIHYLIPEKPRATITPPHYDEVDIAPGEIKQFVYYLRNTGNTVIDFINSAWQLPIETIQSEEGALYLLNTAFNIASAPTGTLAIDEVATFVISLSAPDDQELGTYSGISPITTTFLYNGDGLANTTIDRILVVRRGPMVASDTVYQVVASDTFIDCDIATQSYFISAWICPGLPDPYNQYGANLTVV
ncbi:MAG: hypothetical protein IKP71_08740, partial [Candidatus Riflebacteria bacterium]|nr:hypothetical protein [Candidatus Riflebacteria bacterium]